MKKLIEREEFIKMCKEEFKHKYRYSKGKYINKNTLNTLISLVSRQLTKQENEIKFTYKRLDRNEYENNEERESLIKYLGVLIEGYRKDKEALKEFIFKGDF